MEVDTASRSVTCRPLRRASRRMLKHQDRVAHWHPAAFFFGCVDGTKISLHSSASAAGTFGNLRLSICGVAKVVSLLRAAPSAPTRPHSDWSLGATKGRFKLMEMQCPAWHAILLDVLLHNAMLVPTDASRACASSQSNLEDSKGKLSHVGSGTTEYMWKGLGHASDTGKNSSKKSSRISQRFRAASRKSLQT